MKFKILFPLLLLAIAGLFLASCGKKETTAKSDNVVYYTCTMHPSVHSPVPGKCPICGMDLVPVYKTASATNAASTSVEGTKQTATAIQSAGHKIKFYQSTMNPQETSPVPAKDSMGMEMKPVYEETGAPENQPGEFTVPLERQQQIGVTYATVKKMPVQFSIRAVGTVTYDTQRHWDYVPRVEGYVEKLFVSSPGQVVEKNAPLLSIYSPDLLTTENEFMDLLRTRDEAQVKNNSMLTESTASLIESAKERLRLWNITDEQIAELEKTRKPMEDLTLVSPFRGVVQNLDAVQGAKVMPGEKLVSVTDLSVVWVWAQFYQDEVPLLKSGLPVVITTSTYPGEKFDGKISVIDPFVNNALRAVRVRIDVNNPDFKLWPEMYVNVALNIDSGESLAVPVNAVLPTGEHNIVFVDKGDGKLEPRFIQLGRQFGNFYQVQSGLTEGERVVDSANFLIDAESQIQGALKSW
ncbi:MAG TPA: efflux RND transporter periplasmic adaptor subunit [Verrucomicrobiae bacterium]|nr:efflux RND transporter periplasmic adaptor subunit [Verrucomicrobiae bacterium]